MKKQKAKAVRAVLFLVTLPAFVMSCRGKSEKANANSGNGSYVFKFASLGTSATEVDSLAIGVYKGFFAEENVTINSAGDVAIPEFVPALLSGSLTGATLMTSNGIAAADNGGDIVAVALRSGTTKELPHMHFVTMKGSPIRNGSDLVGKKIGVPALDGCNAGFPLEFAKQAGVENPSKALKFVVAPPEVLMDALKRGEIDVAGLHNMPDTTAKLYPEVDILFTDYDIFGNRGGDITYWFPKKFVEQNPDAIRHFVAALAKTNNWINENPEEAKRLYIEKINPNANAELLTLAHFGEDALIDDSHTQLWIDILSSGDSVQPLKRTWSVEELTTNRYNPNY